MSNFAMITTEDIEAQNAAAANSLEDSSKIADYVKATADVTVYAAADSTATIIGTLKKEQVAIVFNQLENDWYEIYYIGQTGYITGTDLSPYQGENGEVKVAIREAYQQPPVINALGDSIVYGDGLVHQNASFVNLLGRKINNATVNNYGWNGSALSGNNPDRLLDRYPSMDKTADIIFVMGGTNDYGYGVTLGTMEDTTDMTYYGGLNLLMCGLIQMYPDSTIVFLTPLKRSGGQSANSCGYVLPDYAEAVENMCSFYGLQFIDLYEAQEVDFTSRIKRYMPDGLHPNTRGHVTIANYLYKTLQENEIIY